MAKRHRDKESRRGRVQLDDLLMDRVYQVRGKLDKATVTRYADLMRNDGELPPVIVMVVEGAPTLVDGWHRVAAAREIGETEVVAEITEGTENDLTWAAAQANLAHGLPLKRPELRNVLRAYVATGQHLSRGRRPKSAREIGREVGGVGHKTVLSWLKADHPQVHKAITLGRLEGKPERSSDPPALTDRRMTEALAGLAKVAAAMRGVRAAGKRQEVAARLRRMAEQIDRNEPWTATPDLSEW